MNLSDIFTGVAHKQLVAVDLPGPGSHQHELNGAAALKKFFGTTEKVKGRFSWHYFADDQGPASDKGAFTFYDAREKSAGRTGRSEWRLYYEGSFLSRASVGDWFVLAHSKGGQTFALVFQQNSAWLRAAQALFGIEESGPELYSIPRSELESQRLELLRRQILTELELDLSLPVVPKDSELMLEKFGHEFPSTKDMSAFARTQVEVDINHADDTLVRWLEREEQLFMALENTIVSERIAQGFKTTDEFTKYSLSVQNRRKSRMGHSLQHHLAELFTRYRLRFKPQAHTEGNNQPDFIFPGEEEYHDLKFDPMLLVMLGAKSTCKDRWRQVLPEADRIPGKHLCTLEAGISTRQTDEMKRQLLTLVVPESLHITFTAGQLQLMLGIGEFIGFVRTKQGTC